MISGFNDTNSITIETSDFKALFAYRGATLISWQPKSKDGNLQESIVDGYQSLEELDSQNGVRNGIMAPFTNRLANQKLHFDGQIFKVPPLLENESETYHGHARLLEFSASPLVQSEDGMRLEFSASLSEKDGYNYPFSFEFHIIYLLKPNGMELSIKAKNIGQTSAPYASGWHPYFKLPNTISINDLSLSIPAASVVEADEELITIEENGTAKLCPSTLFNKPELIGTKELDVCFAELAANQGDKSITTLTDPKTGVGINVYQDYGLMHVYSADTVARGKRQSIALEPIESYTNAFNLEGLVENLVLNVNESRTFKCGFTYFQN